MRHTDKELVVRTLDGDTGAFTALVNRYRDAAYGIALHVLGEPHAAAEVAQDAFFRAYRNLHQLREPGRFAPWLCRIVMNLARDRLAIRGSAPALASLEDAEELADPRSRGAEDAEESEVADLIRQLMQKLPDEQRLTFTLFYIDGYSYGDLSDMLGVPVGTVKSRLSHARSRLRKEVVKVAEDILKENRPDAEFWRSATGAVTGRVTSAATGAPIQGAKIECQPGQRVDSLEVTLGTNLGVVAGRTISAATGEPIEGSWVRLTQPGDGRGYRSPARTDRSGSFFFHSVPAGLHEIGVAASDVDAVNEISKREITVEPGKVVHLDLVLPD